MIGRKGCPGIPCHKRENSPCFRKLHRVVRGKGFCSFETQKLPRIITSARGHLGLRLTSLILLQNDLNGMFWRGRFDQSQAQEHFPLACYLREIKPAIGQIVIVSKGQESKG
jgi:hypothetical protein